MVPLLIKITCFVKVYAIVFSLKSEITGIYCFVFLISILRCNIHADMKK